MNEDKVKQVNTLVRAKSRTELITMCKERTLAANGTKHDMAVRLIGGWDDNKQAPNTTPTIPQIVIRKNTHGHWTYEGIVFDDKTKNAIGTLSSDGTNILPLQREHIEICKKYKFRYILPEILDDREDLDAIRKARPDSQQPDDEEDEEEEELEDMDHETPDF